MIFLELFFTFLKIGAFTFGGGYAMLPLIIDAVISHGWMSEAQLIDFVAVSESTPGPFAVNIATYIGSEIGGIFGAELGIPAGNVIFGILGSFCATLGVVLPSFVIILIVAKCYAKFKESKWVKGCMSGLKPAVVGLIASALLSMAATVFIPAGFNSAIFKDVSLYLSAGILALSTFLAFKKVHPILIICISAAIGIAGGYLL